MANALSQREMQTYRIRWNIARQTVWSGWQSKNKQTSAAKPDELQSCVFGLTHIFLYNKINCKLIALLLSLYVLLRLHCHPDST